MREEFFPSCSLRPFRDCFTLARESLMLLKRIPIWFFYLRNYIGICCKNAKPQNGVLTKYVCYTTDCVDKITEKNIEKPRSVSPRQSKGGGTGTKSLVKRMTTKLQDGIEGMVPKSAPPPPVQREVILDSKTSEPI